MNWLADSKGEVTSPWRYLAVCLHSVPDHVLADCAMVKIAQCIRLFCLSDKAAAGAASGSAIRARNRLSPMLSVSAGFF